MLILLLLKSILPLERRWASAEFPGTKGGLAEQSAWVSMLRRIFRRWDGLGAVIFSSLVAHSSADSATAATYVVAPLSVPGANCVAGEEIAENGVVAGGFFDIADVEGGFLFDGALNLLPTLPGGSGMYANSVNYEGTAVGYALDAGGQRQAVVWSSTGGLVSLGTLGGDRSTARGINQSGVVVGDSRNALAQARPFSWSVGGGLAELPISLGGSSGSAVAINDAGLVAGRARNAAGNDHAVLFDPSTDITLDLGTLGGPNSFANGLSPNGYVVGLSDAPNDEFRPFFWSEASGLIDVFASGDLGAPFGAAFDVNSQGMVVGCGEINDDFDARASFWTRTGGIVDLNTLIEPGTGWVLLGASGINDAGQIVGWGTFDGVPTGFLLNIVPEPGTALLAGLGLAGLAVRSRTQDGVARGRDTRF